MFITSKNGAVYPTWNAGKRCSFQPGDLLLLAGLGFTPNPQNIACLFQTSYLCPSLKHCFSVCKTLPYERCHLEQWHYNSLSNFCYLRDRPIPKPTSYYVTLVILPIFLSWMLFIQKSTALIFMEEVLYTLLGVSKKNNHVFSLLYTQGGGR